MTSIGTPRSSTGETPSQQRCTKDCTWRRKRYDTQHLQAHRRNTYTDTDAYAYTYTYSYTYPYPYPYPYPYTYTYTYTYP